MAEAIESLKLCPLLHTTEFSRKADRLLVNIIGGTDLTLPMVNELMTAVTEQFGRDSHVIMGAVIDEARRSGWRSACWARRDIGSRGPLPRRPSIGNRTSTPATPKTGGSRPPLPPPGPAPLKGETAAEAAARAEQNEFAFSEVESRGYFDKTDRNLFEGQDLDVPTYLRKGIKVTV